MARAAKTVSEKTPHKVPRLILAFKMLLWARSYPNSFPRGLDLMIKLLSSAAIEDS